jgi:phenylalanyl-tRNA synthetase beta chain
VTIGPSPQWLASRLTAAGVRPINNVVDVTNYVLLELGQPLHAFDLERLAAHAIRVRRARLGETLTTLDGQERTLTPDMLVIADADRPQAVAGVMGGAESEVSDATRLVLLESAHFDPAAVRRASKALGLKTEASIRFERGVDPELPPAGVERACTLLARIGAGEAVGGAIDCHTGPTERRTVTLRASRIPRVLGFDIAGRDVERILSRLGFLVKRRISGPKDHWTVVVPTFRADVSREIDLIEEVGRHMGYDHVPETFPVLDRVHAGLDPRIRWDRLARQVLAGAGFFETMTFAFIERSAAEPFLVDPADGLVAIANPLSEKFGVLRPSLLPNLVDAVSHTRRRERRDVRVFETGACFSLGRAETRRVAFAWTGEAAPAHWSGGAHEVDFYDAKGLALALAGAFGASVDVAPAECPYLVSGRTAALVLTGQARPLGLVGQLRPSVAAARDLPAADAIYVAELDMVPLGAALAALDGLRAQPLPRHPSIVRDLSIVVDEHLPAAAVRGTIRQAAPDTLVEIREFDRYQGQGVPPDRVSLSLRLTFRAPDRTLTDAEAQQAMERIVAALATAHHAVQR